MNSNHSRDPQGEVFLNGMLWHVDRPRVHDMNRHYGLYNTQCTVSLPEINVNNVGLERAFHKAVGPVRAHGLISWLSIWVRGLVHRRWAKQWYRAWAGEVGKPAKKR